jgi:hypothetical protein
MGLETAVAIGAGASLLNAGAGYFENKAARRRSQNLSDQALGIASQPIPGLGTINSGQDSFMQYLRANPKGLEPFLYDQSKVFEGLKAQDAYTIGDQVNKLRAGAGSLGERFGSGFASREAMLRGRFGADIAARNAGISQSAFNTALQASMQSFMGQQSQRNAILQFILGQRGQQLQALGFGAGLPMPSPTAPLGQGGFDISQLMLLSQYLGNKQPTSNPTATAGGFVQRPVRYSDPFYGMPS